MRGARAGGSSGAMKSRTGTITKYVSANATTMSPMTATSGERMPSADLSKPMRLTWIANRTAMSAAIHPRSAATRLRFCRLQAGAGLREPLGPIETDVGDDALVGVAFGLRGAVARLTVTVKSRIPAATPTTQFGAWRPISSDAGDGRKVCKASTRHRAETAFRATAWRAAARGVPERVEREWHGDEDRERRDGQPGGAEQHDREQQREAGARPCARAAPADVLRRKL